MGTAPVMGFAIQDFRARRRGATLKERSAARSHFNDLCRALGVPPLPDRGRPRLGRCREIRRGPTGARSQEPRSQTKHRAAKPPVGAAWVLRAMHRRCRRAGAGRILDGTGTIHHAGRRHPDPRASYRRGRRLAALVGRALRRRCPYCGGAGIFAGYFSLRDRCPTCGVPFDREEGYFLGAMLVNLLVAEFITVAVAVSLMVFTDLSLVPLEIIAVSLAVGLPILFYPYARMLWMAVDLHFDPPERQAGRRLRGREMRR